MSERRYLVTSYKEKDRVKALGARWDPGASRWYVPSDLDLAPFNSWLPAAEAGVDARDSAPLLHTSTPHDFDAKPKGIPLSRLLDGVATAVAGAFANGVWTTAEVVRVSISKGHYFLELSERSDRGDVVAQGRAVIWAREAERLVSEFKRATGADLDAGIKVLLRARPVFKAQFGFRLEVDDIDPSYTLGDLEARKREIRERLKHEGLFDRNRQLPAPWDYTAVLVISPERAAGLGDFAKDAQLLEAHGVCRFSYVHSRFQGEGAAAQIAQAIRDGLRTWSKARAPEAVVIIRGGGSVNDLAWLNDYDLARCICECPVPVLTGIGHERDDTSIDEVSHRRFDTPSKVIAGIKEVVQTRAREARAAHESVLAKARSRTAAVAAEVEQRQQHIQSYARTTVVQARSLTASRLSTVRAGAVESLHTARSQTRESLYQVRSDARAGIATARHLASSTRVRIDTEAMASLRSSRHAVDSRMPYVLERASRLAMQARHGTQDAIVDVFDHARRSSAAAGERSESLFREVAGQGPQKTLRRGFAVVRSPGGPTITSAAGVSEGDSVEVSLRDGVVGAVVRTITLAPTGGS